MFVIIILIKKINNRRFKGKISKWNLENYKLVGLIYRWKVV